MSFTILSYKLHILVHSQLFVCVVSLQEGEIMSPCQRTWRATFEDVSVHCFMTVCVCLCVYASVFVCVCVCVLCVCKCVVL